MMSIPTVIPAKIPASIPAVLPDELAAVPPYTVTCAFPVTATDTLVVTIGAMVYNFLVTAVGDFGTIAHVETDTSVAVAGDADTEVAGALTSLCNSLGITVSTLLAVVTFPTARLVTETGATFTVAQA
jgi:hypothetical protein